MIAKLRSLLHWMIRVEIYKDETLRQAYLGHVRILGFSIGFLHPDGSFSPVTKY